MPPLEPDDPRQLGAYRLTARLGQGGQGVVYLGHAGDGTRVAVKVFHAQLTADFGTLDTFAREMDAAKQVARFCTAQVLDSGTVGDRRYIVTEYVDGPPLSRVVAEQGPRSGAALDRLAVATATALVALHDAGIVHRDLKPDNVLIGADGPRVIDFGISRALSGAQTMVSRAIGTPAYMAPEQLQPGELGPAVDVFAWASTMAFAATGRPPFGNESIPIVFNRIANGEPNLDGIEEPLRGLLAECFTKDPARRPAAQDVLDRLVRRAGRAQARPAVAPVIPALPSEALPPDPLPADAVTAPHGQGPPAPLGPPLPEGTRPGQPGPAGAPLPGGTQPGPADPRGGRRKAVIAGAGGAVAAAVALVFAAAWLADGGSPDDGARADPRGSTGAATSPSANASQAGGRGTVSPSSPGASNTATSKPPSAQPSKPRPSASQPRRPKPVRVELGPGHFTAYCKKLGWEWVEYRTSPSTGAYCVKNSGATMKLSSAQLDAGCQWRYGDPRARHYFNGKSNWCYALKPAS
ncbi:serine/threonine-protein kinase [Actinomadura sp. KC06]|uniref:serine/threonine protein kinase n=1 Tax=Actinomadura sp. KC06 TaxID=2530369 RepID=UPI00140524EB|nr:serine/threonine-protein kinase [Actinomadura sp. KC06]